LYNKIKTRFSKVSTAKAALDDLQKAPNDKDIQAQLRVQLKKLMMDDVVFAKVITQIIQNAIKTEVGAAVINQVARDDAIQLGQKGVNISHQEALTWVRQNSSSASKYRKTICWRINAWLISPNKLFIF